MLYNLLVPFADQFSVLNVFRYLTFRSGGAIITALLLCFVFGPAIIRWLRSKQGKGQPIRDDGPESHLLTKQGTPTMGGVMMLLSVLISTLLWADLTNPYIWIVLLVLVGYGALGFVDDYLKVVKYQSGGLRSRWKFFWQVILSLLLCVAVNQFAAAHHVNMLAIPFVKDLMIDLTYFYPVFVFLVVVGSSNAVNLTDGLDGLAIVPIIIAAAVFGLFAYLAGNAVFAEYLQIPAVPGSGEVAIICAAIIGSGLGFLWFNTPPAQVFMGDTGSLSLGATIGAISVITKQEIVLAIVGGLFVIEALSVMIQVAYFKMTGKRVFLMAPIHHHYEKKGWSEPTIVMRFWIIAIIFALIGLSTLKLR